MVYIQPQYILVLYKLKYYFNIIFRIYGVAPVYSLTKVRKKKCF